MRSELIIPNIVMIVMIPIFIIMLASTNRNTSTMQSLLGTDKISEKLDALLEWNISYYSNPFSSNNILYIALLIAFFLFAMLLYYFFLSSKSIFVIADVFLIGKEKERYEHKRRLRDNFIWGVIVTSIISILSGLLLLYIQKK